MILIPYRFKIFLADFFPLFRSEYSNLPYPLLTFGQLFDNNFPFSPRFFQRFYYLFFIRLFSALFELPPRSRFFIHCPDTNRLGAFSNSPILYLLVYLFAYPFYAANAVFDSLFNYLCHPLFILILTDNLPQRPSRKYNRKLIPLLVSPFYYRLYVVPLFCYNRSFFYPSLLIQNKRSVLLTQPVRFSVDYSYLYFLFILVAAPSFFPLAVDF